MVIRPFDPGENSWSTISWFKNQWKSVTKILRKMTKIWVSGFNSFTRPALIDRYGESEEKYYNWIRTISTCRLKIK